MLACLAALPLPYALGALLAWVAINNAPVPEARAEEGGALALEVTRNAEAYHRIMPVFVARAELEAACAEGPVLFAYAPHVVLPTCVAAFTYGGPVRRALDHLETIANMVSRRELYRVPTDATVGLASRRSRCARAHMHASLPLRWPPACLTDRTQPTNQPTNQPTRPSCV